MAPKRDEIATFLESDPSRALCDECLGQALGFSVPDVTMSTTDLAEARDRRVDVRYGWCSECRRHDRVSQSRADA